MGMAPFPGGMGSLPVGTSSIKKDSPSPRNYPLLIIPQYGMETGDHVLHPCWDFDYLGLV